MVVSVSPRTLSDNTPRRAASPLHLASRRLLVASNRGPLEYHLGARGDLTAERGSGGLVTALSGLAAHAGLSWVACAMTDGDRAVARGQAHSRPTDSDSPADMRMRFVVAPPAQYNRHYNVFANPVLWFVQHNLHHLLPRPAVAAAATEAWYNGYLPVNHAFADTVVAELRRPDVAPVVLLHDYQLYMAAGAIRERAPDVLLQHFVHIPWPEPASWEVLPRPLVRALCQSLLANDVVGFQTRRDAANFLATCAQVLPTLKVDHVARVVCQPGRCTHVRTYPISVDVPGLRVLARSAAVAACEDRLRPLLGEQTIVRVDRLDPSKNVATGFLAFRDLLGRRPDLLGKVTFLSFLVPTRTGIAEYQRHAREVFALVGAINQEFGREGWQPIEVFYENNYAQAIAAMRLYDVLMVNSSLDGMNLVSKEGPIVNRRAGVLVLSRGAGSYEQLRGGALGVAPFDTAGTSLALERALAMPAAERHERAAGLRLAVERDDLSAWLRNQLADLADLSPAAPARRELLAYALSA
ncbi:MAG: alpha,alpha-trehalose-phosphate synthase (UDP-forming) [Chloroflexota bacterium]